MWATCGPAGGRTFLSTLSLRRATLETLAGAFLFPISIHALLAESDNRRPIFFWQAKEFLSTLSLRRATARRDSRQQPAGISIHALLAESDTIFSKIHQGQQTISIHALLAESDQPKQPRTPKHTISIHALLAESDFREQFKYVVQCHFYPRSPCGERHVRCFSPAGCWRISIHALLA